VQPDPRNDPLHGRLVRVGVDGSDTDPVELADALDRNKAPYPGVRAPIPLASGEVIFAYEDAGATKLARTTATGGYDDVFALPAWVSGCDLVGDVLACAISDDVTTVEIHVGKLGGPLQRATDHTHVLRDAGAVPVPMERFVATSADGTEVECWALRPDGDGPFPTLLNIHGGPFTQYGYHLFDEFQIELAAGFGVILCNPRGSSGYSEDWARAVRWPEAKVDPGSGWGGVDYDDVMACADAAVAQLDWVDGDRLGVLGGSYGGYMTSWIVGHNDRFKAACSERAVNNLINEEHNSDAATGFAATIGMSHLEAPEAYARQSPATYAREMHTPLLILHSEDDLRCPINQADELFVALRLLGRTPEYWRFPGEGHELSRSGAPKHRVQRAEIILDFFSRHLA
jgi:dipeptidyl aminopeptidase/acylaminoacyl peptidase